MGARLAAPSDTLSSLPRPVSPLLPGLAQSCPGPPSPTLPAPHLPHCRGLLLTRIWCLYEIWKTVVLKGHAYLHFVTRGFSTSDVRHGEHPVVRRSQVRCICTPCCLQV